MHSPASPFISWHSSPSIFFSLSINHHVADGCFLKLDVEKVQSKTQVWDDPFISSEQAVTGPEFLTKDFPKERWFWHQARLYCHTLMYGGCPARLSGSLDQWWCIFYHQGLHAVCEQGWITLCCNCQPAVATFEQIQNTYLFISWFPLWHSSMSCRNDTGNKWTICRLWHTVLLVCLAQVSLRCHLVKMWSTCCMIGFGRRRNCYFTKVLSRYLLHRGFQTRQGCTCG